MDMTAAMELRVKNDQAKAALAATKADLKGVGDAARGASVEGAKVGPAFAGGATKATPAVAGLEGKLEELKAELGSVVAAEKDAVAQTAALAAQASKLEGNLVASGNGAKASGGGMRMFAQQMSQVGQQSMATGNFVQALAIQLPDIGLAFGTVGIAAGLLAGVALPVLMSAFGGSKGEALTLDEAVGSLSKSLDAYKGFAIIAATSTDELRKKFGEYASEVKGFAEFMQGVALDKSLDDLTAATEPLKGGLVGVVEKMQQVAMARDALARVDPANAEWVLQAQQALDMYVQEAEDAAAALGLNTDQAKQLADALDRLGKTDGSMSGMRDAAAAALAILEAMVPEGGKLPAPLRDAAAALNEIVEKTAEATAVTGEHVSLVDDLSAVLYAAMENAGLLAESGPKAGWLSGAISDATTLAAKLWDAAAAAAAADGSDAAGNPTEFGTGSAARRPPRRAPHGIGGVDWGAPPATRSSGAGGGGGAVKIDPDSFTALTKAAEDVLETLENKVRAIHEKVRLGLMSTAEGTKAIASAKDQAANSIAELIPKLEKAADAAGPKAAAAIAKWRAEVKGLVGDLNEASAGLADKLSSNFEKGFADFLSGAKKGKAAMADFKNFVIQQLAAIAAQRFTESIITPFIDSIVGSITGGFSGGAGVQANARGGVYAGPGISAYSGTVVSHPTFFPFAKGTGLMGEAGPEAILPLDRDGSGRLGVRASGGRGGVTVNVINNATGTKVTKSERSSGGSSIIDVMIETVESTIAGNIAQGRGPVPDALSQTYGLTRAGK